MFVIDFEARYKSFILINTIPDTHRAVLIDLDQLTLKAGGENMVLRGY